MPQRRTSRGHTRRRLASLAMLLACGAGLARAAEHVTLRNGFELDCVRRESVGDKVRLYFAPPPGSTDNYMEVPADQVLRVEWAPDPTPLPPSLVAQAPATADRTDSTAEPTPAELREMLSHAGAAHHIDTELLASVVHAESGGHAHAVSRAGARGLMQLMPGTASSLGVQNSFAPDQNVEGGTRYLDALLTRYHDNMALALAAYNAGPGAVDRFHGVPPFRETRAYVARIIGEFNRRKAALLTAGLQPGMRQPGQK